MIGRAWAESTYQIGWQRQERPAILEMRKLTNCEANRPRTAKGESKHDKR